MLVLFNKWKNGSYMISQFREKALHGNNHGIYERLYLLCRTLEDHAQLVCFACRCSYRHPDTHSCFLETTYSMSIFSWQKLKQSIVNQSTIKPPVWKRYMEDVIYLLHIASKEFLRRLNSYHDTINSRLRYQTQKLYVLRQINWPINVSKKNLWSP